MTRPWDSSVRGAATQPLRPSDPPRTRSSVAGVGSASTGLAAHEATPGRPVGLGATSRRRVSGRSSGRRAATGLLLALVAGGCGDLYSSQEIPLREYTTLDFAPGCIKPDGEPWLVTGKLGVGRVAYVQRVLWDDPTLDIQVWQEPCADLLLGPGSAGGPSPDGGLEVCLVTTVSPDAAEGTRDITLYVEAGDGIVLASGTLAVFGNCEAQ